MDEKFITLVAAIQEVLARLETKAGNHFDINPEHITQEHIIALVIMLQQLKEAEKLI